MATDWIDPCDLESASQLTRLGYTVNVNAVATTGGPFGTGNRYYSWGTQGALSRALKNPGAMSRGLFFTKSWAGSLGQPMLQWWDRTASPTTPEQCCLTLDTSNGQMQIKRGGAGGTVVATASFPSYTATAWTLWEYELVLNGATSTFKLWANGVQLFNVTGNLVGASTAANMLTHLGWAFGNGNSWAWELANVILWNDTAETNGLIGRIFNARARALRATAAGSAAAWTPTGAAANYDCVNDVAGTDGDTTRVEAAATADDLHTIEDLPGTVTTVLALSRATCLRVTDASLPSIRQLTQNGSGTTVSADLAYNASYVWQVNHGVAIPGGGALTPANVNALEAGYRYV